MFVSDVSQDNFCSSAEEEEEEEDDEEDDDESVECEENYENQESIADTVFSEEQSSSSNDSLPHKILNESEIKQEIFSDEDVPLKIGMEAIECKVDSKDNLRLLVELSANPEVDGQANHNSSVAARHLEIQEERNTNKGARILSYKIQTPCQSIPRFVNCKDENSLKPVKIPLSTEEAENSKHFTKLDFSNKTSMSNVYENISFSKDSVVFPKHNVTKNILSVEETHSKQVELNNSPHPLVTSLKTVQQCSPPVFEAQNMESIDCTVSSSSTEEVQPSLSNTLSSKIYATQRKRPSRWGMMTAPPKRMTSEVASRLDTVIVSYSKPINKSQILSTVDVNNEGKLSNESTKFVDKIEMLQQGSKSFNVNTPNNTTLKDIHFYELGSENCVEENNDDKNRITGLNLDSNCEDTFRDSVVTVKDKGDHTPESCSLASIYSQIIAVKKKSKKSKWSWNENRSLHHEKIYGSDDTIIKNKIETAECWPCNRTEAKNSYKEDFDNGQNSSSSTISNKESGVFSIFVPEHSAQENIKECFKRYEIGQAQISNEYWNKATNYVEVKGCESDLEQDLVDREMQRNVQNIDNSDMHHYEGIESNNSYAFCSEKVNKEQQDNFHETEKTTIYQTESCDLRNRISKIIKKTENIPEIAPQTKDIPLPATNCVSEAQISGESSPLVGFKLSIADSTISDSDLLIASQKLDDTVFNILCDTPNVQLPNSINSPRRISLDDRIELELRVKESAPPPPPPSNQFYQTQAYPYFPPYQSNEAYENLQNTRPKKLGPLLPTPTHIKPDMSMWEPPVESFATPPPPPPPPIQSHCSRVLQVNIINNTFFLIYFNMLFYDLNFQKFLGKVL